MKAQAAGLSWAEAAALTDSEIEERLFPAKPVPGSVRRPEPDYGHIYHELRKYRKFNPTLIQPWLEYKEEHPDGYQYSRFCELYRRWKGKLDYYMRQEHGGGTNHRGEGDITFEETSPHQSHTGAGHHANQNQTGSQVSMRGQENAGQNPAQEGGKKEVQYQPEGETFPVPGCCPQALEGDGKTRWQQS